MTDSKGSFTVPLNRRDGRRIWVSGSFNEIRAPEDGRRRVGGTFRDVTAEHYAVQREAALAAMGLVVSRAGSAAQVRQETLGDVEYFDSAGVHALFAHASRIRLIVGPLLEPVLTVSGLSGITSAGEPQ